MKRLSVKSLSTKFSKIPKLSVITTALLLAACQPAVETKPASTEGKSGAQVVVPENVKTETERMNQWFAEKYEEELQQSPMMMTYLGRKDSYDQFDDMSEENEARQLAWQVASFDELKANFNYDKLSAEGKISYDIWQYQTEEAKAQEKFRNSGYVFTQMHGMQAFLPQFLINYHRVDAQSDMVAYNKRIGGLSEAISVLLKRAQKIAANGIRPPKFAYDGIIEQSRALISGVPFTNNEGDADSALWADAKTKVNKLVEDNIIGQDEADKLLAQTKTALVDQFFPAYESLAIWFEKDIQNTASNASGVGSQPDGQAYYNYRLKASTTTDLTADEVHKIGLNEVARITEEMEAIKNKVGFEGSLQEFFTFIKTDEQFFFPNTDEGRQGYITTTEEYLDQINKELPNFFGILPKAPLEVKRVEPFREQDGAAQHYSAGTPDGSRAGVYYAHLSDMSSMPKNEMEGIAYHEGNPGHHMQISIAQELTSVPQFRTQAGFTAYSEGWGLYAELLAKEMGGYKNDYSDFGRLVNEIWRAVRLVVDTGLHSKGWTEEQAIAYFTEKAPVAPEAIKSEIRRYIVWPGQATAYKIGMLKIIELRANAEKQLGDKFDIRGFHDTILGGGAMPLSILERRVDEWIATVNKK